LNEFKIDIDKLFQPAMDKIREGNRQAIEEAYKFIRIEKRKTMIKKLALGGLMVGGVIRYVMIKRG